MRAAVLAVGSELLSVDRLDTNSLRLAAVFERHGVELVGKAVVGDDETAIASELRSMAGRAGLVVVTGGLGPTADDVTREAVAAALGLELDDDPEVWAAIERRFASFGRTPSPNNRRQARVPRGALVLANPRGSAPGLRLDLPEGAIFLFPGVPYELDGMIERDLEPWLAERSGGRGIERRTLRTAMRPESEIDLALDPMYAEFGREWITVLAAPGEVKVQVVAAGTAEERRRRLDVMASRVRELLGDAVYGEGDQLRLEDVVGSLLAAGGRSIATAESCTGGLLAERLTRVPGSSGWFPGGVIAYSNAQKVDLLGVTESDLATHGAVSEVVARALAEGARRRFGTDFGVGVTGVAGPTGGTPEKPVGTVHLAVAAPAGTRHRPLRLLGDRERVRWQATQAALEMVRRSLLELGKGAAA
ncbi:MAG: CinA-like protein [Acidobacteriota bacterium]